MLDVLEVGWVRLNKLFYYSHESGELVWRADYGTSMEGDVAGSSTSTGHLGVLVDNKLLTIHEIVFYLHYQRLTTGGQIYHVDGNPLNNRISNLREVSSLENSKNAKRHN